MLSLSSGEAWREVLDWTGYPDRTTVNDKRVEGADYDLPDAAAVHLSIKDGKLTGVTYTDKDGKSEELLK